MKFLSKGEQAALEQLMAKLEEGYKMMEDITDDPTYLEEMQEDILKTQRAVLELQKKILAAQKEVLKYHGAA